MPSITKMITTTTAGYATDSVVIPKDCLLTGCLLTNREPSTLGNYILAAATRELSSASIDDPTGDGILAYLQWSQYTFGGSPAAWIIDNSSRIFVPLSEPIKGGTKLYLGVKSGFAPRASFTFFYTDPIGLSTAETEPRGSVELLDLSSGPSPNSKDVQALKTKVINARDAYICCETNKNRLYGAINGTLIGLFNALEGWSSGQVMALVPGPVATPWLVRIITIAETSAAAAATLGSLVIIGGVTLIGSLAAAKAAYDMLGLVGTAIGTMVATADPGCFNCVREKTLSQKHPRKRLHDQNILKRL